MQHIAARKIRERGFSLIVSDRNPQAVCRKLADVFLEMDTFDVPAHLVACEDIKRKFNIRAVMTSAADCHYTVSRVASNLNLHSLSSLISEVCRNKAKTRELLAIGGLYQPASHVVQTYSEALAILERSNTAVVVKASDNSGSRGFSVVPIGGKLTKEQFEYTRAMGTTGGVILEEKLEADTTQISEASVETLWYEGKMYWINWVDRIFPRDLKFFPDIPIKSALNEAIEVGHINPARHDYHVKSQVEGDIEKGRACHWDEHGERWPHIKGGHFLFNQRAGHSGDDTTDVRRLGQQRNLSGTWRGHPRGCHSSRTGSPDGSRCMVSVFSLSRRGANRCRAYQHTRGRS
jgi:hypothetical protein